MDEEFEIEVDKLLREKKIWILKWLVELQNSVFMFHSVKFGN